MSQAPPELENEATHEEDEHSEKSRRKFRNRGNSSVCVITSEKLYYLTLFLCLMNKTKLLINRPKNAKNPLGISGMTVDVEPTFP